MSTDPQTGARFAGKTVVVTGAASGIGRATALAFAGDGALVYAADIDATGLAATAAASNGEIQTQLTDVTQTEDIRARGAPPRRWTKSSLPGGTAPWTFCCARSPSAFAMPCRT